MAKSKPDHPMAWTWRLDCGLCLFAKPSKVLLIHCGKPSPEAKPVCVRLVPNVEYLQMIAYLKLIGSK